jgi:ubiquinone/menaquinone biosynthesis C-methylase UbiE
MFNLVFFIILLQIPQTIAFMSSINYRPNTVKFSRFGEKVYLDYICGLGDSTKDMEYQIPRTGDHLVVGMDPNPIHIKLAQQRYPYLHFIHGNLPGMRLPKNQFDMIQMKRAFLTIKNKEQHIKEIYKVLKPKGVLLVVDYSIDHPYIQELRSVEIPLTQDIINYHPMAHHQLLQHTFDDWTDSWEHEGLCYNSYVKY